MELLSEKMSEMIYRNYMDLNRLYHVIVGFGILLGVIVMLSLMVRNGFRLCLWLKVNKITVLYFQPT